MAITLGNKTKLTSEAEKLIIEAGGGNPNQTLSDDDLREALVNGLTLLAEHRLPYLIKLYKHIEKSGKIPTLESLVESS